MRHPKERHSLVVFLHVGICILVLICVQEEEQGRRPQHFGWEDFIMVLLLG